MNDKDKEAYNNWLEERDYIYDDLYGHYRLKGACVSVFSETEEAWQAACEYKDREQYIEGSIHESGGIKREMTWRESSDMFERMYMNTISRLDKEYERIRSIKAENKKLRELIDDLVDTGMDNDIATRIEALKKDEGA